MNQSTQREPFTVDDWTVFPSRLRMERDGVHVEVEPKVMDVLLHLADRPGRVMHRRDLLDALWPEVVVGDEALTRAIYELRKALGDSPRDPRYIETIPKVGYRLVAEVRHPESPATAPTEPPLETSRVGRLPIAIGTVLFVLLAGAAVLRSTGDSGQDIVEPDPVTIRRITTDPGIERTPAASPDGSRVAYEWRTPDGASDLYVRDLESGRPVRLTSSPGLDHSPAWSPDGDRIAFIRIEAARCRVMILPALGGPESEVGECEGAVVSPAYHHLSWSPDGRWLAYSAGPVNTDGARIRVLDLETGEPHELPLSGAEVGGAALVPTFAPGGDRLAFVRFVDGSSNLVVSGFRDGRLVGPTRTIVTNLNNVDGIAWSGDGRQMVFSSDHSGLYTLYRVTLDETTVTPLVVGTEARRPTPIPKSDLVLFESCAVDHDVWVAPGPAARGDADPPIGPLVDSTSTDEQPAVSPDGRRVAFVSNRTGLTDVWVVDADGGMPTRLTRLESQGMLPPLWSPDGSRLLVGAQIGPGMEPGVDLWIVDDPDSPPRRLTEWPGHEILGAWSEDGRWIYFGARATGDWEIWRVPVGGGQPRQVTDRGGYVSQIHEGRLVYNKHDRDGLWSRPLEGGAETLVTEDFPSWDRLWILRDGAVWRVAWRPSPYLVRLDLETGEWERVLKLPNDVVGGLDLAPGLERLYIGRDAGSECDLRAVSAF